MREGKVLSQSFVVGGVPGCGTGGSAERRSLQVGQRDLAGSICGTQHWSRADVEGARVAAVFGRVVKPCAGHI